MAHRICRQIMRFKQFQLKYDRIAIDTAFRFHLKFLLKIKYKTAPNASEQLR